MNQRLWDDIESFLAAESVELDDLDLKGGGKARILKVTVDSEGDLGLGRITDLARGISRLLDEKELVNGPYTLEVTSPGLERKLKRLGGILEAAATEELTIRGGEKSQMIPMGDVIGARTVFRWEAQAKPGRK